MSKKTLDNLLMHPKTRASISAFIAQPVHALLIVGEAGSGKKSAAKAISADLLGISMLELEKHPYFIMIQKPADKQEIPIDLVRNVLKKMSLKTQGTDSIRRVVVIEDAYALSEEAQNALLKILEEPAADTVFILTAPSRVSLLPTIVSRTRVIPVHGVSKDDATNFYELSHESQAVQNAWHLSSGNAKLLGSILANEQNPLKESIEEAKTFLSYDTYRRLLMVDPISKDKQRLDYLFEALERVLEALQRGPNNQGKITTSRLLKNRQLISKLRKARISNVNTRLIVLELALNLKI